MPLAFESISHGTIAFGFFNIDSDMLLLDRYFLFATEFGEYISSMAKNDKDGACETSWQVYYIADPEDIGDLMGAIHAVRHTGFIGKTYRRFPFPLNPEDFKQKPEGYRNREIVESMIEKYAEACPIPVITDKNAQEISIGAYRFTRAVFHQLLNYVWRGGYPRWKDEVRPGYVMAMKQAAEQSGNSLFAGIVFE
ncbi:MAG: hypothetical protein JRJ86_02440 [Deltaproteobacteria bacterium]|nr:hypothetical protein [Deltaproteobacteria bacterium]MBW2117534.1 hypothetical protein [Deltaproteobacteria bacterium]MBW2345062.1 hypothetical protein [Deltaproteobacteria bacterium]